MTDRELLELAAKAAGIDLKPMQINNVREQGDDRFVGYMTDPEQWSRGWFNPLTDDGDALRLAAALKIDLEWHETFPKRTVEAYRCDASYVYFCANENENDYRRAIVRVAAEIGKQMGGSDE